MMRIFFLAVLLSTFAAFNANAGMLLGLFGARHSKEAEMSEKVSGLTVLNDIAYGPDNRQKMDVYIPANAHNTPVIFMVHGGGWRRGNKEISNVVNNKVSHWASKGFIFISTDYRMLPDADPLKQAEDVTLALSTAQSKAASWGGDPSKFILMGHSAGAHLIALIDADPDKAKKAGVKPWLGSVLLDSGALNVVQIMEKPHYRLYDTAFGKDRDYWRSVSPFYVMNTPTYPILAVCSTKREYSCEQAYAFVEKANKLTTKAHVLEMNMTHEEINEELGKNEDYTRSVDTFMAGLDDSVKERLRNPAP